MNLRAAAATIGCHIGSLTVTPAKSHAIDQVANDANRVADRGRVAADVVDVQQAAVEGSRTRLTSTQSAPPTSVLLAMSRSQMLPVFKLKLPGLVGVTDVGLKQRAWLGIKVRAQEFILACQGIAAPAGVSSSSPPVRLMVGIVAAVDVGPGQAVLNPQLAARHIERGSRVGIAADSNLAEIGLALPNLEPTFAELADGRLAGPASVILLIENGRRSIDDDRRVLSRQIPGPGVAVHLDRCGPLTCRRFD